MRKLVSAADIDELKLGDAITKRITKNGHSVQDIITAARMGTLKSMPGIGAISVERIFEAVKDSGFILDESAESQGVRRLLSGIFDHKVGTTEEYEIQGELSREQIDAVYKAMEKLTPRERKVLSLRFGLKKGTVPLDRTATGRELHVTGERIRQIEAKAVRKLKHPLRVHLLVEAYPEFPGIPEDVREACIELERDETPIEERSIEWLELSVRTYNCLTRAEIFSIKELIERTPEDLLNVRNFLSGDLPKVQKKLAKYGLKLKEQPDA